MDYEKDRYIRFDLADNAIDNLQRCVAFLAETEANPKSWKWAAIAAHDALYSFCICALQGTNPDLVMEATKKGKKKLITFPKAFRRCQQQNAIRDGTLGATPLSLDAADSRKISTLQKEFRNNFAHFHPRGWSIEVRAISDALPVVFQAIRSLILDNSDRLYGFPCKEQFRTIDVLVTTAEAYLQRFNELDDERIEESRREEELETIMSDLPQAEDQHSDELLNNLTEDASKEETE